MIRRRIYYTPSNEYCVLCGSDSNLNVEYFEKRGKFNYKLHFCSFNCLENYEKSQNLDLMSQKMQNHLSTMSQFSSPSFSNKCLGRNLSNNPASERR